MSGPQRTFLVITVDIDPSRDAEFNEWYDTRHLPEVLACPGFVSGRRLRALDTGQSPRYVTCYEIEGPDVLDSPEVKAVAGWGPFADEVTGYARYWFHDIAGSEVGRDA